MKTKNVGWEVDLSTAFEGTEAAEPDPQDPVVQPSFELQVGETCRPHPDYLQALRERQDYKILIRREGDSTYWYLDINGKQGTFSSPGLTFWTYQWEKI